MNIDVNSLCSLAQQKCEHPIECGKRVFRPHQPVLQSMRFLSHVSQIQPQETHSNGQHGHNSEQTLNSMFPHLNKFYVCVRTGNAICNLAKGSTKLVKIELGRNTGNNAMGSWEIVI